MAGGYASGHNAHVASRLDARNGRLTQWLWGSIVVGQGLPCVVSKEVLDGSVPRTIQSRQEGDGVPA